MIVILVKTIALYKFDHILKCECLMLRETTRDSLNTQTNGNKLSPRSSSSSSSTIEKKGEKIKEVYTK